MTAKPITQKMAAQYIENLHRHHVPVVGDIFRICAEEDGRVCGVIQCGRPVARCLQDGYTVEVTRLCTDGTRNACSFLYSRAARVAKELGYKKIITYILESEPGTSLRAAGWTYDGITSGGSWDRKKRSRIDKAPTCKKQRWIKWL